MKYTSDIDVTRKEKDCNSSQSLRHKPIKKSKLGNIGLDKG
jgi:hypothetical protein